jgi:hypothetical protein
MFGAMDKHTICLYIFVFACVYIYVYIIAMLLIVHDLHRNYALHIIDVLNLFEHCISLEILVFDSCWIRETLLI